MPEIKKGRFYFRESLPHRKHKEGDVVNRLWNDEELMRLIDLILQGYMYRDVTKNKTVPMSTLWTRLVYQEICFSMFMFN